MIPTAPRRRAGIVILAAVLVSACATGRPTNRFIREGGSRPIELMEAPLPAVKAPSAAAVEAAVAKATLGRRAGAQKLPTIEGTDQQLARALERLGEHPDADAHIDVGQAYSRLGVFDVALDHFDQAIGYDSRAGAAYDGRARIWRDWHLPGLALGDAYRAITFAPRSPVTQNTLGTVLMALGDCVAAEAAFRRALSFDAHAAYATANLGWLARNRQACRDGSQPPNTRISGADAHPPTDDRGAR